MANLSVSLMLKLFKKKSTPWNNSCFLHSKEILIMIRAFIVSFEKNSVSGHFKKELNPN